MLTWIVGVRHLTFPNFQALDIGEGTPTSAAFTDTRHRLPQQNLQVASDRENLSAAGHTNDEQPNSLR
jgi:hypothetical protein